MRVLGMISGTSHDGIDAAIVDFTPDGGAVRARIEFVGSYPYSTALDRSIAGMLPPAGTDLRAVCMTDTEIGQEFAEAARRAIDAHHAASATPAPVDAVCTHGQTVYHWVEDGLARGTTQLGQPAWIAEATGLPVVSDVRAADIAAGGQGAPLVPLLDAALLGPFLGRGETAGALNLGGIANVTLARPGQPLTAWDIGPANALIDAVVAARGTTGDAFDRDGRLAASGHVDARLLAELLTEPYYTQAPPKSTGKELFHLGYVDDMAARAGVDATLPDLVATLTELTARTVADALAPLGLGTLIASGGGVRNPVLMARLRALLPGTQVVTSDAVGVPSDQKEAVAFALIGWATMNGLSGNVPECTGAAGPRILGRVTPAPQPAAAGGDRVPAPAPAAPGLPWSSAVTFDGPGRD